MRRQDADKFKTNKFALLAGAALRERWRWAKQHLYAILVLAPLVVGMAYVTAARVSSYAPAEWRASVPLGLALAALAAAALAGLSLSRASAEIYHLRRPESLADALPVPAETHLHAALAARLARNAAAGIVALVARPLLRTEEAVGLDALPAFVLFVALAALGEALAALEWIHWGHAKDKRQLLFGTIALAPTLLLTGASLLLLVKPALLAGDSRTLLLLAGFAWCFALYALVRRLHARWRAADVEFAKRLHETGRLNLFRASFMKRLGERSLAAQVARDLQLTLRGFSSAAYVSFVLAALWLAALAAALTTNLIPEGAVVPPGARGGSWVEATLLMSVVVTKLACVFAVMSLAAVLPVLVAYQLPHLWLERAAGARGAQLWRAKLKYTRLLTLPAPLAVWALAVGAGATPLFYALPLLAECLWLWWLVSTLMGSLAFEMPARPGLALVVMIFAGLSAGLLTAWLWPAGLLAGMLLAQAEEHGAHRAQYLLAEGED